MWALSVNWLLSETLAVSKVVSLHSMIFGCVFIQQSDLNPRWLDRKRENCLYVMPLQKRKAPLMQWTVYTNNQPCQTDGGLQDAFLSLFWTRHLSLAFIFEIEFRLKFSITDRGCTQGTCLRTLHWLRKASRVGRGRHSTMVGTLASSPSCPGFDSRGSQFFLVGFNWCRRDLMTASWELNSHSNPSRTGESSTAKNHRGERQKLTTAL